MDAKIQTVLVCLLLAAPGVHAEPKPQQIDVSLFGQPCTLTGPLDRPSLQVVHSISPERMPIPDTLELTRKSLASARKITGAPAALDRYRSQLVRRLEAQETFFEAFHNAKKSKRAQSLFEDIKAFQGAENSKRFQTAFNKLLGEKTWASLSMDDATALYAESLDVRPEEEFHRSIQKMGVRYVCSFEAEESGGSDEDDSE